jgi:hypothetical protein
LQKPFVSLKISGIFIADIQRESGEPSMKRKFKQVYQFRIDLREVKPPVWRRIQVPETYTFWDLHVAIQDAMGWDDCHLHQFTINATLSGAKVEIGLPAEDDLSEILAGWEHGISDYFSAENKTAEYWYDFGNNWRHTIFLEKILQREKEIVYPRCIDGQRACPPEDCGGALGYENFLEIIMDPGHEQYDEMLAWAGDFEPEYFDKESIVFDDPAERFETLWD